MCAASSKNTTATSRGPLPTRSWIGPTSSASSKSTWVDHMHRRYRIGELIAEGGMAKIHRAVDEDGRAVAIKTITELRGLDFAERFRRESAIRIEHPNVVRVLDTGVDEAGALFIVFELLEGETLAEYFERGLLAAEEARRIGVQICRGVVGARGGRHPSRSQA